MNQRYSPAVLSHTHAYLRWILTFSVNSQTRSRRRISKTCGATKASEREKKIGRTFHSGIKLEQQIRSSNWSMHLRASTTPDVYLKEGAYVEWLQIMPRPLASIDLCALSSGNYCGVHLPPGRSLTLHNPGLDTLWLPSAGTSMCRWHHLERPKSKLRHGPHLFQYRRERKNGKERSAALNEWTWSPVVSIGATFKQPSRRQKCFTTRTAAERPGDGGLDEMAIWMVTYICR